MILGATATLILNLSGLFATEGGLNLPGVASAISAVVEPCRPWLLQIVFVTINLLALITTVLNGYFMADYYHKKDENVSPIAGAVVSFVAFLCFIDFSQLSANFDWPAYILGSPSLFGGILISILAIELYRFLIGKKFTIKMPEAVPPMIAAAFTSMVQQGHAYENLMVNLQATNAKLKVRTENIVMQATGCERRAARDALGRADGQVKTAILMLLLRLPAGEARVKLHQHAAPRFRHCWDLPALPVPRR